MPRPTRRDVPGLTQHLTAHAVDRQPLFLDDLDRHAYLGRLTAAIHQYGVAILDFCLMHNHLHLLTRAPARPLARAMQQLHGGYARAFNERHGRRGHLFDGRYKVRPVLTDAHLHAALRYIAHNPVEARVCAAPAGWRWSGYRALAGLDAALPFHAVEQTLTSLDEDLDAARRSFLEFTVKPPA